MNYQDTWAAGAVKATGERDCADRYEAIWDALMPSLQSFTALDLGANGGYFSVRLAEDFDCHITAIDDHFGLHQIASDRITVIDQRMAADQLRRLRRHDITLALSVLHHMTDWRGVLTDLAACRHGAFVEVPHPDEDWFRIAKARREVREIHHAAKGMASVWLGEFERIGRDQKSYLRPMYFIPGRVQQHVGTVFAGSGTNSRRMLQFGNGLASQLGYTPYWGSLNVRFPYQMVLEEPPHIDYLGRHRNRTRDYQFWRAWIGDIACHAMIPGTRGHGPDCLEIVAPVQLRDHLALADGDQISLDIEMRN